MSIRVGGDDSLGTLAVIEGRLALHGTILAPPLADPER
jgi:hypothetical protein